MTRSHVSDALSDVFRLRPGHLLGVHSEIDWDERARAETPEERLDRNWASLLQELRVLQTSVQLLTGFLLILPFQARFDGMGTAGHVLYGLTFGSAMVATVILLAPIALHRLLFGTHHLAITVSAAHRCVLLGMASISVTIAGGVGLITQQIIEIVWLSLTLAMLTFCVVAGLWLWLPLSIAHRVRSYPVPSAHSPREKGKPVADNVYRVIEVVGSSTTGIDDAISTAVSRASKTLENLDWFEVVETRGHIENGAVAHYQVTLKVGFALRD